MIFNNAWVFNFINFFLFELMEFNIGGHNFNAMHIYM